MYDYLIDHALKNIWCTPDQDRQAILKPVRITPDGGSWNFVQVLYDQITLPEQKKRYHVYQIGQLHPELLGLFPSYRKWEKISTICSKQTLICDIYDESGIEYPRFQSWYMVTKNKNLIVAVEKPQKNTLPIDFYQAQIYMRVYSNEYFNSNRAQEDNNFIHVNGKYIGNAQDINDLQTEFQNYQTKIGHVYCFVNGYRVNAINTINCKVGDLVEYVYDSSIKAIYDFSIRDLKTFNSILDQSRKYLLHYPGNTDTIDFQDDIDVFLIKKGNGNQFKGIYHHKNQEKALRNLTHKDYSVDVDIINAFASYQSSWTDLNDLTVRLHIRHSGYKRNLVYVSNRIHELYKLDEETLIGSLLGIDSNVEVFKAENLENSAYCEIMRSTSSCLDKDLVQEAYGYNSISQVFAMTPKKTRVESGIKVADVSYGLMAKSTAFEYDANGHLIDFYNHTGTSVYAVHNAQTDMVEQISCHSSHKLDEYYNQNNITLDPKLNYKFYTCQLLNGLPDNHWVEDTDQSTYVIINNVLTWIVDPLTTYTLVRSDNVNLGYNLDLMVDRWLLKFSLTSVVNKNSVDVEEVMTIPMGRLDIFLNGRSLIEGLDYFVKFPEVVICNKEYLIDPENQTQRITIRFTGHCDENLEYEKKWDAGFIDHALLSNNNRFDIRDDKVLKISVDGALYDRSELLFAESDSGVSVPDARNGAPYQIRDIVPQLSQYLKGNPQTLIDQARDIDKIVSDYMTIKVPGPTITNPNVIDGYYRIYSPFLGRIISDLLSGIIDDPRLTEQYSDEDVMDIVKDYEYLLDFDPVVPNHWPDDRYVIIDAYHLNNEINVNIYQYKFIDKVVSIYCNNKITLNNTLKLIAY